MTSSGTNRPGKREVNADDVACQAARDIVHQRIDAEASADELFRLNAHLQQCDSCSRYAAEVSGVMLQVVNLRNATDQPIGHGVDNRQRPRFAPVLLRVAAMIAIGFVGIWAWSVSHDRTIKQFVDGGPAFGDPNSIGPDADVLDGGSPPPVLGAGDQSPIRAARIINPRSRDSAYIPVRRDTSRPNVKLFALYEKVR